MTIDDKLIPQTLKAQCDSAMQILEQNNADIETMQRSLENFIVDDELVSEAYSALKKQISDYLSVTSAMISANEMDIADLQILKTSIGDEELRGDMILNKRDVAYSDMNDFHDQATAYIRKSNAEPDLSVLKAWYYEVAEYYEVRSIIAGRKYDLWLEKERQYDEIEAMTQNLFTRSSALRDAAKRGMESITGAFQNGTYHIDMSASWRTDITAEKSNIVQELKSGFIITNGAAGIVYNWTAIEEWLQKDAGEVSELEYLAFIELMSEMSVTDLENVFATAQIKKHPWDDVYGEVSDVMKEASERYLMLAKIEAEFTIFNAHSKYEYNEVEITNELSRAIFIYQVMNEADTGKRHEIHISELANDSGKITYVAEMTTKPEVNYNPSDAEAWGRATVSDMESKTVRVNPWGTPATAEQDLEDRVNATLLSLDSSMRETIGKVGVDYTAEYVFSKIGEGTAESIGSGLSYSITLLELTQDIKEDYENSVAIHGAINIIEEGQAIDALGIRTGVISVTGSTENSVGFICSKYSPEELMVRIAAYNNSNETPITVGEVIDGFENGGQAFTDYMDWYYEGGDGEIEEYWDELQKISLNYYDEYPENIKLTTGSMNLEQLQELINKYNDPSYEINAEIMGEQE